VDNIRRSKLWAGILAISLLISSTGFVHGTSFTAHALGLGTSRAQAMPSNENKRRHFPIVEEAAEILGLQTDKVRQSLKDGKSLLDLAKEQGLSEADFTSRLLAVRNSKVDEALKSGKITKEKADKVKAKMQEHISFMINSRNLQELHSKDQKKSSQHEERRMMSPEKLAAIIGIPEDKLVEQLKAGKSITEIAEAQGMTKQQLVAKIKDNLTPYLNKALDHKSK
jgi:plasmid maintenance system antidote protein VapI